MTFMYSFKSKASNLLKNFETLSSSFSCSGCFKSQLFILENRMDVSEISSVSQSINSATSAISRGVYISRATKEATEDAKRLASPGFLAPLRIRKIAEGS